jgi:hypothetical protein
MELERTIVRRMSVDPATLHPSRPVLSADEMTGARAAPRVQGATRARRAHLWDGG